MYSEANTQRLTECRFSGHTCIQTISITTLITKPYFKQHKQHLLPSVDNKSESTNHATSRLCAFKWFVICHLFSHLYINTASFISIIESIQKFTITVMMPPLTFVMITQISLTPLQISMFHTVIDMMMSCVNGINISNQRSNPTTCLVDGC